MHNVPNEKNVWGIEIALKIYANDNVLLMFIVTFVTVRYHTWCQRTMQLAVASFQKQSAAGCCGDLTEGKRRPNWLVYSEAEY